MSTDWFNTRLAWFEVKNSEGELFRVEMKVKDGRSIHQYTGPAILKANRDFKGKGPFTMKTYGFRGESAIL